MLLDRVADVHLAQRCGADGWLVKPLDPLRLRRAVQAVAAGGTYHEGLVDGSAASSRDGRCRPSSRRPIPPRHADGPRPPSRAPAEVSVTDAGAGRVQMTARPGGRGRLTAATGCSAAWLARHVRDVEAGGSNPLTPTECPASRAFGVLHLGPIGSDEAAARLPTTGVSGRCQRARGAEDHRHRVRSRLRAKQRR